LLSRRQHEAQLTTIIGSPSCNAFKTIATEGCPPSPTIESLTLQYTDFAAHSPRRSCGVNARWKLHDAGWHASPALTLTLALTLLSRQPFPFMNGISKFPQPIVTSYVPCNYWQVFPTPTLERLANFICRTSICLKIHLFCLKHFIKRIK
jgi:hypothetical protein